MGAEVALVGRGTTVPLLPSKNNFPQLLGVSRAGLGWVF